MKHDVKYDGMTLKGAKVIGYVQNGDLGFMSVELETLDGDYVKLMPDDQPLGIIVRKLEG